MRTKHAAATAVLGTVVVVVLGVTGAGAVIDKAAGPAACRAPTTAVTGAATSVTYRSECRPTEAVTVTVGAQPSASPTRSVSATTASTAGARPSASPTSGGSVDFPGATDVGRDA